MTAYGLEDDTYRDVVQKAAETLSSSVFAGAQLVNHFPLRAYSVTSGAIASAFDIWL